MSIVTDDAVKGAADVADIQKHKPTQHLQFTSLLHSLHTLKNSFNQKPKNGPWPGRRRGSTQSNRSVHFDSSPAVHYTHSKEDYDRGGGTSEFDHLPTPRWKEKRPPLLDDTDEDDCNMSLISDAATNPRRRASIHSFTWSLHLVSPFSRDSLLSLLQVALITPKA